MKRLIILAMVLVAGCVGGCETSRGARGGESGQTKISPMELAESRVKEVHEVRQRRVDEALGIEVGEPGQVNEVGAPSEVLEEWTWLGRALFAEATPELKAENGQIVQGARFDEAKKQIVVNGELLGEEAGVFAFDFATNLGLERLAFEAIEPVETVDEWFAKEIIRQAGPAFVSTLLAAKRAGFELSAQELAARPELSLSIPVVGEFLREESGAAAEGAAYFEAAMPRLIMREAIALGAALYRAGGWSGLEWGRIEAPTKSDYAVRPDRWFSGDGAGEWGWDEYFESDELGWELAAEGKVGPVLTALWLEGIVGAQAARTIFSGWLSDAYRVYRSEENGEEALGFMWVSAWKTPYEAQEVAGAIDSALKFYGGFPRESFAVEVEGVHVGVVAYTIEREQSLLEEEVAKVRSAKFGIIPDEPSPLRFEPTLYEYYSEVAGDSTLEGELWRDEVAGWQARVEALDGWAVQKSDETHVRWFAIHPDSTTLQWTTELTNPLGPEFGTEAYLEALKEVFSASVESEEPPYLEVKAGVVDPMVELEVVGTMEGRPLALRLWQWRRGDVLVTFSVQGPQDSFGERLIEAEAVMGTLSTYGTALGEERPKELERAEDDEGILEFRLEEE